MNTQLTIFGLGRMGLQIAKRLQKNGVEVLAWNRSEGPRDGFAKAGGKSFAQIGALIQNMTQTPRIFWVMLPNDVVEDFIFGAQGLAQYLKAGDIVIDGGNSFYKDSIRRAEQFKKLGVHFFDCGTSGGIWGERNGFAIMVGGPKKVWPKVESIFKILSSGTNYGLVGGSGAGHFVKMVHNGIEYGMMEAIAEGYNILQASPFQLDLGQVTKIYQEGSVVRSWLVDLMADIFAKENIDQTVGVVRATGEGEWTVKTAEELGIDARVIKDALAVRKESEQPAQQTKFRNKILALLRKQFGGHEVTTKQ